MPWAGLDDANEAFIVVLVHKMARESHSTILFVSHRKVARPTPDPILKLNLDPAGFQGILAENQ
ncbi:MAG: hypothetical protein KJO04_06975 [Bacteroidia bacterium]|nr:hypothetical protein [Bacteroidia bacterium]